MSDEPELQWRIAGQTAHPDGSAASLELGRELPEQELEELNNAIRLLVRLAQTEAYTRAAQLMQTYGKEFAELIGRDRPPPAALLTPLARSAAAVILALRRIPESMISIAGECTRDEQQLEELRGHIAELEHAEPWRLAIALDQYVIDPRRNLAFEEERLILRPEPLAALAAAVDADAVPKAVGELLGGGMLVAAKMTSRQLLACSQAIREASLLVRQVGAEVLLGYPVLVGFPPGEEPTSSLSLTHKPLPLPEIEALQQALVRARFLLNDTAAAAGEHPDEPPVRAVEVEEVAEQAQQAPEEGIPVPGHWGPGKHLGPPPPASEPQPLDFDTLVEHLGRLPAETERAWSRALDADLLSESQKELRAEWGSLLVMLYREANDSTERLRARGVDPVLFVHPEDPAVLHTLNPDGPELDLWRALSVAQMRALLGVTTCLEALTAPRAPFGLGRHDELTWWEAGAFALIRLRACELARVTRQLNDAERALGTPVAQEHTGALQLTGPWRERLTLADEAVLRGDPEASVLHLRLALRERAAQLAQIPLADVPPDIEQRLASDPELEDMVSGLHLLARVGDGLNESRPLSLGFALPVGELMLAPVSRLCLSLSAVLVRATRDSQDMPTSTNSDGKDQVG
jgi:hypothetical protein